jgi:hypothetical protein
MKCGFASLLGWCVVVFLLSQNNTRAAMYNYQMYPGNGVAGAVGNATLAMSNTTSTVRVNFVKGIGSFSDNLVIFVDTAPGGYASTSPFSDRLNALQSAVSGYNTQRSVANFAPGFEADYAIVIGVNSGSAVFKLVDDGTGPHLQLVRNGLNFVVTDSPNHPSYSFQFDWVDIGLPAQATNFFKFETSYISSNGYRRLQSFETVTGTEGFNTINFSNYDTYGVPPVPENTTVALGIFGGIASGVAWRNRRRSRKPVGQPFQAAG